MLYLPGMEDLRLIEVEKENLTGMPGLIRSLAGRRQKFILFPQGQDAGRAKDNQRNFIAHSVLLPFIRLGWPTQEWIDLGSTSTRRQASQVPDELLQSMATDALLQTVLDYPFLSDKKRAAAVSRMWVTVCSGCLFRAIAGPSSLDTDRFCPTYMPLTR